MAGVVFLEDLVPTAQGAGPAPPLIPNLATAVPTWSVQLAVESVIDHAFTIGTSTIGGTDVLGGGLVPTFQDITADVMSMSIKRGRNSNLDAVMQGTAQLSVTDSFGKYNPLGGYKNAVLGDQPLLYWRLNELFNNLGQTITGATWSSTGGGQAVFTVASTAGITNTITVTGINPAGYNNTFGVLSSTSTTVTVPMASNPGAYVSGGFLAFALYATDSSGFGSFGTYTGSTAHAVTFSAGPFTDAATCITLDGLSGAINGTCQNQGQSMSTEIWFKTSSSALQELAQGFYSGHVYWRMYIQAGNVKFIGDGGSTIASSGTNYADGAWHYLAITFPTSNVASIYLDNVLAASGTTGASSPGANITIYVGSTNAGANYFSGSLAHLAVYHSTLSTTRIATHWAARLYFGSIIQPLLPLKINATFYDYATSVLNDKPSVWYRLNDAITSTLALDASGNGLHGSTYRNVMFQQQSTIVDGAPAAFFDGVAYVQTPVISSFQPTVAFSIEAWFMQPTLVAGAIASQYQDANNNWTLAVASIGGGQFGVRMSLAVGGVTTTFTSGAIVAGEWYHSVGIYSNHDLTLVVNGYDYGTLPVASLTVSNVALQCGNGAGGYFQGYIGDFTAYAYALPITRAVAHYKAGVGFGGDTKLFHLHYGFLDRPESDPEPKNQLTTLTTVDLFEFLRATTPTIATQYAQRTDQLMTTILAQVPITDPTFIDFQPGPDLIAAWGDAVTGQSDVVTLFENLTATDLGFAFIAGSGAVTYRNRASRFSTGAPLVILDGTFLGAGTKPSADKQLIVNYEQAVRQFSQQTLTASGGPTGGNFTLTLDGQTTGTIAFDASAGAVATALQALGHVGASGVTCTGGPLNTTPVVCSFVGFRIAATLAANNLTGGTNPSVSVSASMTSSTAQTANVALSQQNFGNRAYTSISSANWNNDIQTNSFANFVTFVNAFSRPPIRNASLINGPATSSPKNQAARRLWQILGRELNDYVSCDLTKAAHGGGTFVQGSIQSIQIDVQSNGAIVSSKYTVQPTTPPSQSGFFIIGQSVLGGPDVIGY